MAKISIVWFSYRWDGAQLLESVRAASRTLSATAHTYELHVADDGMMPLDRAVRDRLAREYHVAYRKTFYPRNGHLIGPDNLIGQAQVMADIGKDCDVLIKMDCDTLLLKIDWVEALLKEAEHGAVFAGSYKVQPHYPMGNCYAVHNGSGVLHALARDVENFPAWKGCYEDFEIGTRIARLCHGSQDYALRWRSGEEDGFWLCSPQGVTRKAKEARVVCCGYTYTATPHDRQADYRALETKAMKLLNDDIEGLLAEAQKEA